MKVITIESDVLEMVVEAMSKSQMLGTLGKKSLTQIANRAELVQYDPAEIVVKEKDPSDCFFMIISGEVGILYHHKTSDELVELARIKPPNVIGEMGLILEQPRTATIRAREETQLLKFDSPLFKYMFENIPAFGLSVCKNLASQLQHLSWNFALPTLDEDIEHPSAEVLDMLPMDLMIRHRVLPLKHEGSLLHIGFVHDPSSKIISAIRQYVPGMELQMARIGNDYFDEVVGSQVGSNEWAAPQKSEESPQATVSKIKMTAQSPQLDILLKRLVGEGASDLHLCAGQIPYWRIDGDIKPIADAKIIGSDEVYNLLEPVLDEKSKASFEDNRDADFAYSVPDIARFRVNLYRDDKGASAAFRLIPNKILTLEQLGMPSVLKKLCDHPKGLVLLTGPTGCGKSTTLAAMIDYINSTRESHIITMEDPIEFVHTSKKSLINQRQIGTHTKGFNHALRSALREDPDIVLVGELRDRETIALALETANMGHLVFGTLHTSTAISTISRIIDVFPPDQQNQIKNDICESIRGVVAQSLCKCIGGGRTAALEILMVNIAIANLIREDKLNQIASSMQTGKSLGHRLMNEDLPIS